MKRVRETLRAAARELQAAGVGSPRFDAEELLAHVLGVPRSQAVFADAFGPEDEREFWRLIRRRAAREPLQHILGEAPFRYLRLRVGPGVFVPRPETEVVAGRAIDAARAAADDGDGAVVVDLCTGSGAIALAVATEVPGARVYACEVDAKAHAWAEANLAGSTVTLVRADAASAFPELDGRVDVVVSNPPYIPLEAYESVEPEVRDHDPGTALWAGADGLDMIRVVERRAAGLLRPGGEVVVEHADVQAESAPAVFAQTGSWTRVRDHRDLAGKPRFVTAVRL